MESRSFKLLSLGSKLSLLGFCELLLPIVGLVSGAARGEGRGKGTGSFLSAHLTVAPCPPSSMGSSLQLLWAQTEALPSAARQQPLLRGLSPGAWGSSSSLLGLKPLTSFLCSQPPKWQILNTALTSVPPACFFSLVTLVNQMPNVK